VCDTFINTLFIVFNLIANMRVNLIRTEHPWELIIVDIFLCLLKSQRVTFPYCRHLVVILMSKYLDPSQDDVHKVGDVLR